MTALPPAPVTSDERHKLDELRMRIEAYRMQSPRPCTHRTAWRVDVATGRVVRAECQECR